MNLVLDDAEELSIKKKTRKSLGRILLKGDNITLMMSTCVSPTASPRTLGPSDRSALSRAARVELASPSARPIFAAARALACAQWLIGVGTAHHQWRREGRSRPGLIYYVHERRRKLLRTSE